MDMAQVEAVLKWLMCPICKRSKHPWHNPIILLSSFSNLLILEATENDKIFFSEIILILYTGYQFFPFQSNNYFCC